MICDLFENLFSHVPDMSINLLIWSGAFLILTVLCEAILKASEHNQKRKGKQNN